MSDSHEHAALSIIRICSIRSSTDLFETSLNESAKLTLFSLNSVKFKLLLIFSFRKRDFDVVVVVVDVAAAFLVVSINRFVS